MTKAEEILKKSADKNMIYWNQHGFTRTHPKLYRVIIEAINEALFIEPNTSGDASDFEKDLFKLVNIYSKQGLAKPDLIKKMEWVLGNCKMS